jgi:hypothetical protein
VLLLDVRHEAALTLGAAMALVVLLLQLETDPTASRTRQVGARVGLPFEHSSVVIVACRLQQASTAMQRSSCQHHRPATPQGLHRHLPATRPQRPLLIDRSAPGGSCAIGQLD